MNQLEIQRLACTGHALRPDWPEASLRSYLIKHHTDRAYHDTAIALAWIATDPATKTPARLGEDGPWWRINALDQPTPLPDRLCETCGRIHDPERPNEHPRPTIGPSDDYLAARSALRSGAADARP